jgi:hypothetical protein
MEHLNSFSKGMESDLTKSLEKSSAYLEANNLRLITEVGKSELSLENIRGTQQLLTIPSTSEALFVQAHVGKPEVTYLSGVYSKAVVGTLQTIKNKTTDTIDYSNILVDPSQAHKQINNFKWSTNFTTYGPKNVWGYQVPSTNKYNIQATVQFAATVSNFHFTIYLYKTQVDVAAAAVHSIDLLDSRPVQASSGTLISLGVKNISCNKDQFIFVVIKVNNIGVNSQGVPGEIIINYASGLEVLQQNSVTTIAPVLPQTVAVNINGVIPATNLTFSDVTNKETVLRELHFYLTGYGIYNLAVTSSVLSIHHSTPIAITLSITDPATGANLIGIGLPFTVTTIPSQAGLIIIGWGEIRDTVVLFTTNERSDASVPQQLNSFGQIWKVNIDSITDTASLELIYNNLLNFTTKHPIHKETQTVGRYELSEVQRIYWTDNFNKPRNINITDPNAFALAPASLGQTADVKMSVPVLVHIGNTGQLLSGIYQYAYRLKKVEGVTTITSEMTAPIVIDAGIENLTKFGLYEGSVGGVVTPKSIRILITDLDQRFENIEVFNIYRDGTAIEIIKLKEDKILGASSYEFTHDGTEKDIFDVDINEITIPGITPIDRCKTLTHKDNRLICGNIRTIRSTVDFDARAYRFSAQKDARVVDSGGTSFNVWDGTSILSPYEKHDSINPDQYIYKFKSDGVTYGGEGANVSYEIKTYIIPLDDNIVPQNKPLSPWEPPRNVGLQTPATGTSGNAIYEAMDIASPNAKETYKNFKGQYTSHYVIGYQPDEYYRFGLELFSVSGEALDVKWIADIKMPSAEEDLVKFGPIEKSIRLDGRIMYVEFKITLPAHVREGTSGFRIVRVERETVDRTVLGDGLIGALRLDTSQTPHKYILGASVSPFSYAAKLDSPTFMLGNTPNFIPLDYIKFVAIINHTISERISANPFVSYVKYYNTLAITTPPSVNTTTGNAITKVSPLGYSEAVFRLGMVSRVQSGAWLDVSTNPAIIFTNESGAENHMTTHYISSANVNKTINIGDQINYTQIVAIAQQTLSPIDARFYVYYKRELLTQYGGNTYIAKLSNKYIACGPYIRTGNYNDGSSIPVFGGDVYTSVTDFRERSGKTNTDSHGIYFPTVSRVNTELRIGPTFNSHGVNSETFNLAGFRHLSNDLKVYLPRLLDVKDLTEFDNRAAASDVKINGESVDSWNIFRPNNEIDVDGVYGSITALVNFSDTIYFLQENAVGILDVSPETVLQDTSGVGLTLGTGEVLQRARYMATDSGTKHQWGVHKTNAAIYYTDVKSQKLYKIGYTDGKLSVVPLSSSKGLQGVLSTRLQGLIKEVDNPVEGIGVTVGHSYRYEEVLFTIKLGNLSGISETTEEEFTIVYNEKLGVFSSYYSTTPAIYISQKGRLTGVPTLSGTAHLHDKGNYNSFYGNLHSSNVKILINPHVYVTKVFDNYEIHTEVINNSGKSVDETFTQLTVENDYQNSPITQLVPGSTIKRRERTWKVDVPRAIDKIRIRDKYAIALFNFNNPNNRKLVIHYIKTLYRPSPR